MDCRRFKSAALAEVDGLRKQLAEHVLGEFMAKQEKQATRNAEIWEKVVAKHTDIDLLIQ